MKTYISGIAIAVALSTLTARAQNESASMQLTTSTPSPGVVTASVENEGQQALARALDWLAAKQNPTNGCWSSDKFPAITALILEGFLNSEHPQKAGIIQKAVACIRSYAREDGGIYRAVPGPKEGGTKGGGLSNYNTAICLAVLSQLDDPSMNDILLGARAFLARSQHKGDDVFRGGFGYDETTGRAYTDMMNTYYAADAMYRTANLEEFRAGDRVDLDWNAVGDYVTRMQNTDASGSDQTGGFFYNPVDPKAGSITNEAGQVVFRSYGSITYVGIMELLYAKVGPDDPRVRSAFKWAASHWTLEENPGMGSDGQYFFYDILGKCMNAHGRDTITLPDGTRVAWREEMIKKLVSLQKIDAETGTGYWLNESNRYMEADPVLVTAYTVQALQHALK